MQLTFGAGDFFATALTDAQGNPLTNATPVRIMGMQEASLEFSGELKKFHGQNKYAIAVAQGKVDVNGKVKGALVNGLALNNMFFGQTLTAGTMKALYADTTGSLIPATPFTITVTPPSSGTISEDLGVIGDDGIPLVKVASAPTTGQYSVAGAVYTFAAADTGRKVYISYAYTYTLASAKRISLSNLAMGYMPTFKAHYLTSFQGKRALVVLANVIAPKLSMFAGKNDDFSVPEIEYSVQTDATGYSIGDLYIQE